MSTTRDRAVALYTFLKEFTELRSKTVRSVDEYDQVLWLTDVPREIECSCPAWDREHATESGELWLEVRQPRLVDAPLPPGELEPWLIKTQVNDSGFEMPELRSEVAMHIKESGEDRSEIWFLKDQLQIKSLWESYVETRWWPWAEADRRAQSIQRVYTQLFSMYQKQQRLGEQYEVILGLGLLSWRTPEGQEVQRHLLAASASVSFDATRGIITVGPAGEGAKEHLEQDMLDPVLRPDVNELRALENQIEEIGGQVWDPVSVDSILAAWVHSVSSRGIYNDTLSPPERCLEDPQVHFAPALILRKRTERSYLKAFEEIIKQLKEGAQIPLGVMQFVTVTKEDEHEEYLEMLQDTGWTSELYFPLPSNEAQQDIVKRLTNHPGVLVQGPPGTGKSHTIVNLICHLLASGQRVLVTSHTARALMVLQRYIRNKAAEISPLAVVLLGDDRDALQAMEDSVQGITHRQNLWNSESSSQRIRQLESRLNEARSEEARALSELRAIRERETYEHPNRFGGYSGTLQAIASRIREEEGAFGWIDDRPSEEIEPPVSSEEFQTLISLFHNAEIDEWAQGGAYALDVATLPSPDSIAALANDENEARHAYDEVVEARHRPEYRPLAEAFGETRQKLIKELGGLLAAIDQISRHLHPWAKSAALQILGGHDRAWRDLYEITRQHLSRIDDRARWVDETSVSGLGQRDHHEVRADAEMMVAHLESGRGWGIGPFRAAPAKRGLYLRQVIKISGRSCNTASSLKDLIEWLDIMERLRLMRERWAPHHRFSSDGCAAQVNDFEDLCEPLESALALHGRVQTIRDLILGIPRLSEPTWHNIDTLRALLNCAEAVHREELLRDAKEALNRAAIVIEWQIRSATADPAGKDLYSALLARDMSAYREAYSIVVQNQGRAAGLERRESLFVQIRSAAPLLAESLALTKNDESWTKRATNFVNAWNWTRAIGWLKRLSDPNAEQQLGLQLDLVRDRIRTHVREIAAEKAWSHCFTRMTEHERQHLVAWSKAVRGIGRGTGKYAPMHRRNARDHLNECRSAIPAWIMPLYRVAETIKPGNEIFDVVIIDEASQSGPEALLLAYMARRIVVVGDDKQISPTYAGINHEDVNQLRSRHIAELPHADSYGVHQSFFDLAEIRYPGRIRLREHFRCMPEIIQFSNNLCYQSEPLIPLRQYGASRLSPVVTACHVQDGYIKGMGQAVTNPPEARAVVDTVLRFVEDSSYEGKTIGVISLLGDLQSREIERLLLKELGPREMEQRQLVCGDAYAFQGDERDVMLLSLVSAPSENRRIGTLTDEASKRRFNVAMSRARDQVLLFHTATLNDLSPRCLRHALLSYCQNPVVERSVISGHSFFDLQRVFAVADRDRVHPPEPFESWFEVEVFLKIAARGYRVLPQYEVAGYRVDLVIEGMRSRIAVECDGDRWHGPAQYQDDMSRQRMLERCGWRFWRVRGSSFSLDPEAALEDLWITLGEADIYPEGQERSKTMSSDGEPDSHLRGRATVTAEPAITLEVLAQDELVLESESVRKKASGKSISSWNFDQDIFDAPYKAWSSLDQLPDPAESAPSDLVSGLIDIVSTEGPLNRERLYRIFVKGSGRQRVARRSRSALNKGVWRTLREGLLVQRDEPGPAGIENILRKVGSAPIVVRPRGDRAFVEIPPAEVATVLLRLESKNPAASETTIYRSALELYETKRMTANIMDRLRWIHERRYELVKDGDA